MVLLPSIILLPVNLLIKEKTNKGIIPPDPAGGYKGNHAMVIVGYDKDTLKIVNSWGNTGDNGYYYLDINSSIIRE